MKPKIHTSTMSDTETQLFTPDVIDDALSYSEYRTLIDDLLEEGKVTGDKQSESLANYTKMNVHRMERLDKHTEIEESLREAIGELEHEMRWLMLTEGWCGDAAQNVPVIHKIAEESPKIELGFLLRHRHEEIMDEFMTNGARSIPKMIVLDPESLEPVGSWGPRPEEAQRLVYEEWIDQLPRKEWAKKLHKWYAESRTKELQDEFEQLVSEWDERLEEVAAT